MSWDTAGIPVESPRWLNKQVTSKAEVSRNEGRCPSCPPLRESPVDVPGEKPIVYQPIRNRFRSAFSCGAEALTRWQGTTRDESARKLRELLPLNTKLTAERPPPICLPSTNCCEAVSRSCVGFVFLISVGTGKTLNEGSPAEGDRIMHWVLALAPQAPFAVKTTEGSSYRRLAISQMRAAGTSYADMKEAAVYEAFRFATGTALCLSPTRERNLSFRFLAIALQQRAHEFASLVDVYRNSEIFRALHSPGQFHGKCGVCEYSHICGGSRARAFAHSGDVLGTDPFCPYEPCPGSSPGLRS